MALSVGDLMTWSPICVEASDTLALAYGWMEKEHVRHLPVVDEDGQLVGLLSHRDLLQHALAGLEDIPMTRIMQHLGRRSVASAMVGAPASAEPGEALAEAGQRMLENKWACLPVCEGRRVVGILTEADFVRHLVELQVEKV